MKKLLLLFSMVSALVAQAQVPTDGLLAYYNFEGNANSHNGLHNFTNLHTSGAPIIYAAGGNGTGYAAGFNETALQNTSLAAEISSEFTVAYWGSKNPVTESLFASRFEMFTSAFHRKGSGSLYSYAVSTTYGAFSSSDIGGGTAGGGVGGWFHYAMSFKTVGQTKVLEFYVNGVLNSTTTVYNTNDIYKYNSVFSIGGGTNLDGTVNGSKFFNGTLDEFYVYNRALSVTEINNVKNAPDNSIVGNAPPLVANISENTSSTTATAVNYTITANGLPTTSVINYGTSATDLSAQLMGSSATGFAATNASVILPNLTVGTRYYYEIVATNSAGTTTSATGDFVQSDPSTIAEYDFNNTYNDVNGNVPFGSDGSLTSFENDRNNVSLGALRIFATQAAAVIPNLPVGNAPRTVSIWVKNPNAVPDAHVFRYGPLANGSTNLVYGLAIQGNNLVNFGYNNDLTAVGYGTTGSDWIHVVTTFDGATAKIYHNGVERASGNKSGWNTQNTNFFLGGNFDISVDDLKIYNRVLTQSEITNLYTNNTLLATRDFNSKNLKATIYPNPTSDNLTIEIENELKSIEVYSIQGQKVMTATLKDINVSSLSKGMYLVRIEDSNNAVTTQKLIVK